MKSIAVESDLSWIIGGFFTLILLIIYWYRRPSKFPPGPRGIFPFGYIPMMKRNSQKTTIDLRRKYGPICGVRILSRDVVLLNDFNSINTAFVKYGHVLSGRPRSALENIKPGGIATLDYGNLFKAQRKFGLMTLRGFGVGKKGMENICLEELFYLNEEIKNADEKAFDISYILHNAISNNICHVIFGKRFQYNDEKFVKMIQSIINRFEDSAVSFMFRIVFLVPSMKYFPGFSRLYQKFLKYVQNLLDFVGDIVKEHEKTFDENNLRDFIDSFLLEKKKSTDPSFTDAQLKHYIYDLFIAGTETTSSTLYWCLLCLLNYPETQKRLRDEIISVIGTSGAISMSKKADFPYVNAFIEEIYRFRTLAPFGLPHKANADVELEGYFIPKGTVVIPSIWTLHTDPDIWKEPKQFNPERFLDEQGNFVRSKYVIPFSVGPRHCLGEQLARMEVFIFLVGMVQKFEFFPDPELNGLPSLEVSNSDGVVLPHRYKLVAKQIC